MYVENKCGGLDGDGRIGWVVLSRSRRTFAYRGAKLLRIGGGYKYNCIDEETGDEYWVSGARKDGADKLYGGIVQIDEDARVAYWTEIRERPLLVAMTEYRAGASSRTGGRRVETSVVCAAPNSARYNRTMRAVVAACLVSACVAQPVTPPATPLARVAHVMSDDGRADEARVARESDAWSASDTGLKAPREFHMSKVDLYSDDAVANATLVPLATLFPPMPWFVSLETELRSWLDRFGLFETDDFAKPRAVHSMANGVGGRSWGCRLK